jgi:hypothetical protein
MNLGIRSALRGCMPTTRRPSTCVVPAAPQHSCRQDPSVEDLDDLDWGEVEDVEKAKPSSERPARRVSVVPPKRRSAPPCPTLPGQGSRSVPPFARAINLAADPAPSSSVGTWQDKPDLTPEQAYAAVVAPHQDALALPLGPREPVSTFHPVEVAVDVASVPPRKSHRAAWAGAAGLALVLAGVAGTAIELRTPSTTTAAVALGSLSSSAQLVVQHHASATVKAPEVGARLEPSRACRLNGEPRQLLSSASLRVPLEANVDASGSQVALGLAATNGRPVGFLLHIDSLRTERSTMEWAPPSLQRVIPFARDGGVEVVTDSADQDPLLGNLHTLRAPEPVRVGTFRQRLTLAGTNGAPPDVLWELPGRVDHIDGVAHPERGATMALRVGEAIYLGWTDSMRRPQGNLVPIATEGATGSVRIARATDRAVLAYEVGQDQNGSFRVVATRQGEREALPFSYSPPDSADTTQAEPSLAALSDERWLLTWTERKGSSSRVRMQTLDAWLRPVGEPVDISPASAIASGCAVVASGGSAAAFFVRSGSSPREAWATSVHCP